MNERPFLDRSSQPTEQAIQTSLGSTYAYYKNVIGLVSSYSQEWTFARSSGWMLKISDRKKALLYLIPVYDGFRVSLAIRENERDAFLRDDELEMMHDRISSAKKHAEGLALQFAVANDSEFQPLELFV